VDIKARNKQVKVILSNAFGKGNISVTNGKGTAWGWCNIHCLMVGVLQETKSGGK